MLRPSALCLGFRVLGLGFRVVIPYDAHPVKPEKGLGFTWRSGGLSN